MKSVYRLQDVVLRYRARNDDKGAVTSALQDVTLDVHRGELLAIVGHSGSGKSSLLQVMAGLTSPDDGSVMFYPPEGEPLPLHELSEDERAVTRRMHIGFIYQSFNLVDTMTAAENVALPLLFGGVPLRDRDARARDMLGQLGLGEKHSRYPYELSGGEQQRVAIARALVANASVILADEPTGSLDSKSANAVIDTIRRQHAELGTTTVLVTHDPAIADRTQRRIELRDGSIVSGGSHK
ncbi:MAG TPA: ABC transporter ATP-binding protein [Gemmatimonadaceae bacterium]